MAWVPISLPVAPELLVGKLAGCLVEGGGGPVQGICLLVWIILSGGGLSNGGFGIQEWNPRDGEIGKILGGLVLSLA